MAAFAAGVLNALAGGGTLVTFPVLVMSGVPPVVANATSNVALLPGGIGSVVGYRHELRREQRLFEALLLPSAAGGLLGARLLLATPDAAFARVTPWLVLAATLLFALEGRSVPPPTAGRPPSGRAAALQFLVAVYGGYFGAGSGILVLAVLGRAGVASLHTRNALRNALGVATSLVAALLFGAVGTVDVPRAAAMAVAALAGGYLGARAGLRLGPAWGRRVVLAVGLGMAGALALRLG